ncbi:hypothetical protein ACSQ67_005760 [Phaseolus vulgaris]
MALIKDDMMSIDNLVSSREDYEKCAKNPPELASRSPTSRKDGMMGTMNPGEVFSSPLSPGKHDMLEHRESSRSDFWSSFFGEVDGRKDIDSPKIHGKRRITSSKKVVDNADGKQISDSSELKETNDEPSKGKGEKAENKIKESQNKSTVDKSPKEESTSSQSKVTDPSKDLVNRS